MGRYVNITFGDISNQRLEKQLTHTYTHTTGGPSIRISPVLLEIAGQNLETLFNMFPRCQAYPRAAGHIKHLP
jgi:hypothetical protein